MLPSFLILATAKADIGGWIGEARACRAPCGGVQRQTGPHLRVLIRRCRIETAFNTSSYMASSCASDIRSVTGVMVASIARGIKLATIRASGPSAVAANRNRLGNQQDYPQTWYRR
jgi:hypothetical protein